MISYMDYEFMLYAALWAISALYLSVPYLYKRIRSRITLRNSPVLLMRSMQGGLINGHQGNTPAGLPYSYLLSGMNLFSTSRTRGMYAVYLPFQTSAHLLGLPRSDDSIKIPISKSSSMEEVVLEGDYPNYFKLYADRGQQMESRYVLDPKAMVFTIDFCAGTHWEIVDNTLFFTGEGKLPSFKVVDQFVKEIRPAIESAAPKDHTRISYGHMNIADFYCPVCDEKLVNGQSWMECPNHHGFLVTGRQIKSLRDKMTYSPQKVAFDDGRTNGIKCPYCSQPMIATRYQYSDAMIDRCSKCIYRWVDKPEAEAIFGVSNRAAL